MKPRDTKYCVAITPQHYRQVHSFMRSQEYAAHDDPLTYPTVVAIRGDKIIGMVSTCIKDNHIIATNLLTASDLKHPLIVILRLVEYYESVLLEHGVTSFFFELDGQDTPLQRYLAESGLEPYSVTEKSSWYFRRISV